VPKHKRRVVMSAEDGSRAVFLISPGVNGSAKAVFDFWRLLGLGIGLLGGMRMLRMMSRMLKK
jgi:hypothetical protein